MFKMERLNHSRTKVYGDPCALFPVDTFDPADRLQKDENGLKFERFDVLSDFYGAQSARPARNGEWQRSPAGFVRFFGTSRKLAEFPVSFYLPATPNEFPRLVALLRLPVPPDCGHGVSRRPVGEAVSIFSPRRVARQADPVDFRRQRPDAAQALQSDSRTCRGVQDGSITGWEDCSFSHRIAGRQCDEEMAQ